MAADPYSAAAMAGFQIINGLQQVDLTRRQAEITKMINEANQEFALNDTFEALASGLTEEARYATAIENVKATQEAQFAYAGVDSSTGTAAQLKAETEVQGLVNQSTIRNNAYARALGLKNEALNLKLQGQFDQTAAKQRAAAQQGAGLMQGVSSAFSAYTASPGETETADQDGSKAVGGYDLPSDSQFGDYA